MKEIDNKYVCRLCGSADKRLYKIYTNIGKEKKQLDLKITKTCGITLHGNQSFSSSICRNCETFVNKMWDFRQKCQQNQLKFHQNISIKRCLVLSPSTGKENKKHQSIQPSSFVKKSLNFDKSKDENTKSSVFGSSFDELVTTELTLNQCISISNAMNTRIPHTLGNVLFKECPAVTLAVKKAITDQVTKNTNQLCTKKENASILYNHTYNGMANFDIEKLWKEINTNFPYLIDIFNAITGVCKKSNVNEDVKHKYCFIYSILMSTRWHELSLFQRINTVLLIEGVCTKKVKFQLCKP